MDFHSTTDDIFDQYITQCRKEKRRFRRMIVLLILVIGICVGSSFIGIARIQHSEMGDNYKAGDIVIYEKRPACYEKDDVVFVRYEDYVFVRRIIGVYKDKINIDNTDGTLYINDIKQDDSQKTMTDPKGIKFPLYVSENQYFVLCDQRSSVTDSRKMGCIHEKNVLGKIIYKIRF